MSSSFTWLSLPLHFQFPPTNLSRDGARDMPSQRAAQHVVQDIRGQRSASTHRPG